MGAGEAWSSRGLIRRDQPGRVRKKEGCVEVILITYICVGAVGDQLSAVGKTGRLLAASPGGGGHDVSCPYAWGGATTKVGAVVFVVRHYGCGGSGEGLYGRMGGRGALCLYEDGRNAPVRRCAVVLARGSVSGHGHRREQGVLCATQRHGLGAIARGGAWCDGYGRAGRWKREGGRVIPSRRIWGSLTHSMRAA